MMTVPPTPATSGDAGLILDVARIRAAGVASLSPHAREQLCAHAKAALNAGPFSVVHKTATPPSGDRHDYLSVGPYWWPDPRKADGLPYIRRDGEVHPDFTTDKYDLGRLEQLVAALRDLAIGWVITGDSAYARHAAMLLRCWFLDPSTRMNPHLLYAQAIPGVCTGRGIGLIDTARFARSLDYVLMLSNSGEWTAQDDASLRAWFAQYLDWMLTHEYGQQERREHNNHGTWCDAQLASFALYVGRSDLALQIIAEVPRRRIFAHIKRDGRQKHELSRTRAFSYSCYNLEGLLSLAWLGRHVNIDLWNCRSKEGRRLRAAIDWLAPYADEALEWPYQQIGTDGGADNPALGVSARAPLYPLLRQAAIAWNEPRYEDLAARHPQASRDYASQLLWPSLAEDSSVPARP